MYVYSVNLTYIYIYIYIYIKGARGVMVFVVGNGHDDTSSNLIAIHIALIPLGKE